MLKAIIIIAILLGAFWYFMPDKFNNTVDAIKGLFKKDSTETETQETQETQETSETTATTEITTSLAEGYCIIDLGCVYIAEDQCPETLYESRLVCEELLGIDTDITPEDQESDYNYIGFPNDDQSTPYECMTDNDCRYDNAACATEDCQCDYTTGECYLP